MLPPRATRRDPLQSARARARRHALSGGLRRRRRVGRLGAHGTGGGVLRRLCEGLCEVREGIGRRPMPSGRVARGHGVSTGGDGGRRRLLRRRGAAGRVRRGLRVRRRWGLRSDPARGALLRWPDGSPGRDRVPPGRAVRRRHLGRHPRRSGYAVRERLLRRAGQRRDTAEALEGDRGGHGRRRFRCDRRGRVGDLRRRPDRERQGGPALGSLPPGGRDRRQRRRARHRVRGQGRRDRRCAAWP